MTEEHGHSTLICSLKEDVARLQERIIAADKALELSRTTLSRNSLISAVTLIVAVLALAKGYLK